MRLITRGAHPQALTERGLRVRSVTGDFQVRQLHPGDRAIGIVAIPLPPGMPWHTSKRPSRAQRQARRVTMRDRRPSSSMNVAADPGGSGAAMSCARGRS